MPQFRIDKVNTKGRVKKTDEGYLKGDAVITRTGVFVYRNPDGSVASRELRHPDDVFNKDSLESLKMRPITNLHPSEKVHAKNAKRVQIGMTGESVHHDAKDVVSSVLITDQAAINAIEAGRQELSAGYFCEIIKEDGVFNGERYDSRQTNIKYNHVAICEKGRAGAEARLNFDSLDNVLAEDIMEEEDLHNDGGPGSGRKPEGGSASDFHITLAKKHGIDLSDPEGTHNIKPSVLKSILEESIGSDVPQQQKDKIIKKIGKTKYGGSSDFSDVNHYFSGTEWKQSPREFTGMKNKYLINAIHSAKNMKNDSLTEEVSMVKLKIDACEYDVPQEVKAHVDKMNANIATITSENATLKGKCDAFEKRDVQKEISEGIKARRELEALAQPVLKDVKLDSLTDEEIKKQVIGKVLPDMKLDNEKPEYIHGVFVGACHAANSTLKNDAAARNRQQSTTRKDGDNVPPLVSASSARDRMIARNQNFGKDVK